MNEFFAALETFAERAGRAYRHERTDDRQIEHILMSWARAYAIANGLPTQAIAPLFMQRAVSIYRASANARRSFSRMHYAA